MQDVFAYICNSHWIVGAIILIFLGVFVVYPEIRSELENTQHKEKTE